MSTRGPLWQYPAKTQPVEPVSLPILDWLVQQPDPVLAAPPRQAEGAFVEEFAAPALLEIDWLVQQPDPIRLPGPLPEQFAFTRLVTLSEIPIDWLVQHPDPVLPSPPRLGEYVLGELVEIPIDTWLRPASQPVLPIERRQDYYVRAEVVVPPPPALLEWWVQHPDPQFPVALIREFFVLEFAAPIGFVFVLRECQALWQMVDRRLWPSGESPSGYFNIVEAVVPSGFVKPSEEPEESTSLWKI